MLRLLLPRVWRQRLPALLAAGALGLAAPVPAQAPPPTPGAGCCTDYAAMAPEAGRLQEIKVELAWLADRTTFPCPLTARARAASLEVQGAVPNEAARAQALNLARQCTALPVTDALKVQPGAPATAEAAPVEDVLPGVMQVLHGVLGKRAGGVLISTRAGGQITLKGAVCSWQ